MDTGEWTDPRAAVVACNRCRQRRPCLLLPDPVAAALYPSEADEHTPSWWCRPCYVRRKDASRRGPGDDATRGS